MTAATFSKWTFCDACGGQNDPSCWKCHGAQGYFVQIKEDRRCGTCDFGTEMRCPHVPIRVHDEIGGYHPQDDGPPWPDCRGWKPIIDRTGVSPLVGAAGWRPTPACCCGNCTQGLTDHCCLVVGPDGLCTNWQPAANRRTR